MIPEIYVYGERLPENVYRDLLKDFTPEQLTTDFLETYFYYEYQDNE